MSIASQARLLVCRLALAAVALIVGVPDRLLGTTPREVLWVPEARVDDVERWVA